MPEAKAPTFPAPGSKERADLEARCNEQMDPKEFPPWKKVQSLTYAQMIAILQDIANGASVTGAARKHNSSLIAVQVMRVAFPEFNTAMNEALMIRVACLEEKAVDMAMNGEDEAQISQGLGSHTKRKDSPGMLQFLLKAYKPEVYGVDRKEIKAGPLDSPPEVIRSDADRQKLIAKLGERMRARMPATIIDTKTIILSDAADLL